MTCQVSIEAGLNKASIWRVWCRREGLVAASSCRLTALIHPATPNFITRVKNLKGFGFFPLLMSVPVHGAKYWWGCAEHTTCPSVSDGDSDVFFVKCKWCFTHTDGSKIRLSVSFLQYKRVFWGSGVGGGGEPMCNYIIKNTLREQRHDDTQWTRQHSHRITDTIKKYIIMKQYWNLLLI